MIKQSFKVIPQGIIQDGNASFEIDETTGKTKADGHIKAGIAFFTKKFDDHEEITVDPKLLLSSNLKTGQTLYFGGLQLNTLAPTKQGMMVHIQITAQHVSLEGTTEISTQSTYIALKNLKLKGTVFGHDVTIELEPK